MSVFERIKSGLEEAVAYERDTLETKTTKITITPVSHYKAGEIKRIRISTGMTQVVFAEYMCVSTKTIEAWKSGRNHPVGSACRLLALTKLDPTFPQKSGIICK